MFSTVNVVVRKAPGQEPAVLGLRAAWAMLTNGGFDVRLLCMGDGVFNLLGLPGYAGDMLRRFMAEGGSVHALGTSLEERGLSPEALIDGVEVVDAEEAAEMVQYAEATTAY
ncbi:DsrE family protein [Desulfovibrio aminophilus]|uniref:DsrE family protein n=1 Tax=Desulfovibrio aminophilus TaxID=81425 RepID=UPI00040FC263|nr:DsrE family protein [Desulfovibrio aminophilus]